MTSVHVHDFLSKLRGVVPDGNDKWLAYCPVHEATGEHKPSLGVAIGGDEKVIVKCLACSATTAEIVHAAGSTMRALFPPTDLHHRRGKQSHGKKVAEYIYRDADGIVVYKTERREKQDGTKTFLQSRPNGQGGWKLGVKGITRVLYKLPELIAAPKGSIVFVVEGEKKVEALNDWGLIATCNVGGAGKWSKGYGKFLAGHDVVILPDNDPVNLETGRRTGFEHAADIIDSTRGVARSIRIIELPGLPAKGDIVDWIKAGGTLPQLLTLLEQPIGDLPKLRVANDDQVTEVKQMDPLDLRIVDSRSDVGNGRRLIKAHGQDLKYCEPWGKWLVWDGKRWKVDDSREVYRRAKAIADQIWEEWRTVRNDVSDDEIAKILAWAKYSSSAYGIAKCLECAASEPGAQIVPQKLDANPWLLNVDNGTIDLQTGELVEHRRGDLLTKVSPTKFDPKAESPAWDKFLAGVFGDDELISYMQRLCGYWSTGVVREQILPVFHGTGSNGKTTFLNAICNTIGSDFAMKAPAGFLMTKRNDSHPTDKADLFGKRVVVCSETDDGKRLDEAMVKEITGNERLRVRRMREDFWEFDPTHKALLVTNHKPVIRGTDHGIWRRIRLVPFRTQFWNAARGESGPEEFKQDEQLDEKLKSEMSGILTWIIQGCVEWNRDGENTPACVDAETREYRSSQDILGSFLIEQCDHGERLTVQAVDLYMRYKEWAKHNGEYIVNQRKFGQAMAERGFQKIESNAIWYVGLQLSQLSYSLSEQ